MVLVDRCTDISAPSNSTAIAKATTAEFGGRVSESKAWSAGGPVTDPDAIWPKAWWRTPGQVGGQVLVNELEHQVDADLPVRHIVVADV